MRNPIIAFFGSPIFTWWNSATLGTRLFTALKGQKVGTDDQGNVYYQDRKKQRRWVIYKNGPIEASRVPAEWHGWLHKTFDDVPSATARPKKDWEKDHVANQTGTVNAYARPSDIVKPDADYEPWRP